MSFRVVGLGEVLWDDLPEGRRLGGAPANFAYHAKALGADAAIVSAVGNDDLGRELLEALRERDFRTDTIGVDPTRATGTVTITIGDQGMPKYTIHDGVAWDHLQPTPAAISTVQDADAICFGTLAQRQAQSQLAISSLLAGTRHDALRVFDVNLRQSYYSGNVFEQSLAAANVVKVNEEELPVICECLGIDGATEADQLRHVIERFELRAAALTRGADGSFLMAGSMMSERPGSFVEVSDTVGAGDSFLAAFVMGLLHQFPLSEIHERAEALSRHVCTCEGATPPIPESIRELFQPKISV